MKNIGRRRAMLLAAGGAVMFSVAVKSQAQPANASISGRAIGPDRKPAKKLGCSVSGANNIPVLGKYEPATGEFSFPSVPDGDSLFVELTFNGEVFRYPIIHRGGASRIDVLLPLPIKGRIAKGTAIMTIFQAVSAIAGLGLTLKRLPEAREKYLGDATFFEDTNNVLSEAQRLIEAEPAGVEKDLVAKLVESTVALWKTLG